MAKLVLVGILTLFCMVSSDLQVSRGSYQRDPHPHFPPPSPAYLAYIVPKDGNQKYPCLGVVLDEQHVLSTTHCVRKTSNPIVQLKYPRFQSKYVAIANIIYVIDDLSKNDEKYPNNLAIIKLQERLKLDGENIKNVKLPSRKVIVGDGAEVSGLYGVCVMTMPRIQTHQLHVDDPARSKNCRGIRSNEFCVKREPKIDSINHGAPVVNGKGEILGFTLFGCNSARFTVSEVIPHVKFIKAILKK